VKDVVYADLVTIAHVLRPQGRKGELLTVPLSDRPDRFDTLTRVFVPGPAGKAREIAVTSTWPHRGQVVVKLEGVDSIAAAEGFRGVDLRLPEAELGALPEGSYYLHQLEGLLVVDEAGSERGRIARIIETGGTDVASVATPQGEVLVPLAAQFLLSVDLEARRAVMRFPRMADDAAR
jgi:16S rRNA processing protein RimM